MKRAPRYVMMGLLLGLLLAHGAGARAIDPASPEGSEEPAPSLGEALVGGTVHVDLRLRAEWVDQDGLQDAEAFTERLRLGYTTRRWRGLELHLDVEDVRALGSDRFNAAGLNGRPERAVVADPEATELNQLFARYRGDRTLTEATVGRQRLILDDARFVGNVGWRQNEQTFDGATAKLAPGESWEAFYGYLWAVNRIFGPDAGRDFESASHLAQLSYIGFEPARLTAFSYRLDFDNAPSSSSSTLGLRAAGSPELSPKWALAWTVSWARQRELGDHPIDYRADYLFADLSLGERDGRWRAGAAYELLGSDRGVEAFQTPLATLHKFNGWADVFLSTPAEGLEDFYLYADASLPGALKGRLVWHRFSADVGGLGYGDELDVQLSRKVTARINALLKFADFAGEGLFADRRKLWLQLEYSF